jgi:preprotein translocase subunit SecG
MEQIILIVHLLLALAIIGLIMLQQGKGAEMGASFGAGASQTLFGSSGSGNVLTRATSWLVALFFVSSFGLAVLAKQRTDVQDAVALPLPPEVEAAAGQFAPADSGAELSVEQIEDLPVVDDSEPAMTGGDMPAAGDIPELPEQ